MTLPADPAELFVRLISRLEGIDFNGYEVFSWMEEPRVRDIAEYIEGAALSEDGLSPSRVEELLDVADPDDFTPQSFATLLGLDRALLYANPYFGSFDQGALTQIAVRYAVTGAFNIDQTSGTLLPRCAFPARRQETYNTLSDVFVAVAWVPRAEWNRTEHLRIPTRNDLTRRERESHLEVVCVPAVSDANDLEWATHERGGGRFYQIALRDRAITREWMSRLLAELDVVGAAIAVLPELTLNEQVLDLWREVVLDGPWGTSILHSPLTTQVRRSLMPTDLARFTLVAGEPVPRSGDPSFDREDGPEG